MAGRSLLVGLAIIVAAIVAFAVAVVVFSGATLKADSSALARVSVQPFGGTIESVRASGPSGRTIPIAVTKNRLIPRTKLLPDRLITVDVVIRRPSWSGWALGSTRHEHLTIRTPVARLGSRWLTVPRGSEPQVRFDQPVAAVSYGAHPRRSRHALLRPHTTVTLTNRPTIGATYIAAAARPWEQLGPPVRVTWFPRSSTPMAVPSPATGSTISPSQPIRLTFSRPVSSVLGPARPTISPATPGHWHQIDSHTLVFKPSGFGAPLASTLDMKLPKSFGIPQASTNLANPAGSGTSDVSYSQTGSSASAESSTDGSSGSGGSGGLTSTNHLQWTIPAGSTLRLQQLLAEAGYLPLTFSSSEPPVPHDAAAEVAAAVDPPAGHFSWRYRNTPSALQELWSEGEPNTITRGAVMKFENENGLTVDGEAGSAVWHTLIKNAIAGKRLGGGKEGGYTYVYVHREVPETLTLWHDGETVLTSPANTGISGAETELGTYPVFEHIPEGTMEGENPDGSHYRDEGIKWISYFNGGDALHNFDRSSFGTPQSLGCVELPLEASAEIWPYTPIGTLVTIAG